MSKELTLTRATGFRLTGKGTAELRGEIDGEPVTIVIPAPAAVHLLAGLATLAADHERVEPSQRQAVLQYAGGSLENAPEPDRAHLVMKSSGGFEITFSIQVIDIAALGHHFLRTLADWEKTTPPTMN